jgi:SAM-dependent methyltransferase
MIQGPLSVPETARRFSNRAGYYARYRPGYPLPVLACLKDQFGLTPSHSIADVGSGTGILSELFLRNGNTVYAVEPNAEMRAEAERLLGRHAAFHSVAGAAEDTTLPPAAVDWIACAQAFHWFDIDRTQREWQRILRRGETPSAGGWVALLWNIRRENTPFLQGYERLWQDFGTDYLAVKRQAAECSAHLDRFFGAGGFTRHSFPNRQVLDLPGLRGHTLSASFMPTEGHPRYPAMLVALTDLFGRHADGSRVVIEYDTDLYVGRLPA